MEYRVLTRDSEDYPKRLIERLGDDAPSQLYYHGPLSFLSRFTMAFICSQEIRGQGFIETNQLFFTIRDYDLNYIGGWLSWYETEIFRLALFFPHPTLTLGTVKGLGHETFEGFMLNRFYPPFDQIPERKEFFRRAEAGELLVLSLVPPDTTRTIRRNIMERNRIACALSDVVFIPCGPKGSKTYTLAKRVKAAGWPVFTLEHELSRELHDLGIPGFNRKTVGPFLDQLGAHVASKERPEPSVVSVPAPEPGAPSKRIIQTEISFVSDKSRTE